MLSVTRVFGGVAVSLMLVAVRVYWRPGSMSVLIVRRTVFAAEAPEGTNAAAVTVAAGFGRVTVPPNRRPTWEAVSEQP
jgi:hypothetical protein